MGYKGRGRKGKEEKQGDTYEDDSTIIMPMTNTSSKRLVECSKRLQLVPATMRVRKDQRRRGREGMRERGRGRGREEEERGSRFW